MEVDKTLAKSESSPNELGFVTYEGANHMNPINVVSQSQGIALEDFNPTVQYSENTELTLVSDVHGDSKLDTQVQRTIIKSENIFSNTVTEPILETISTIDIDNLNPDYKPQKCKNCGVAFVNLKEHSCSHILVMFECVVCDKTFKTKKLLQSHFVSHRLEEIFTLNSEVDKNQGATNCVWCKKYFSNMDLFYNHLSSHSLHDQFLCHICEAKFYNQGALNQHFDEHKTVGDYRGITFHAQTPRDRLTLKDTAILRSCIKNMDNKNLFYCNLCATVVLERNDYHMKTFHRNYVESYRCHVCGAYFYKDSDLMDHLAKYADNGTSTKVFKSQIMSNQLEQALRSNGIHSSLSSNSNNSFNIESNSSIGTLLEEDKSNEDRNHFYCQVCKDGIPYNDEKLYKKHFKSHKCKCGHPDCAVCKSKPLLYCIVCDKHYSHERSLKSHQIRMHQSERQRTEKCSVCDKSFYAKCTLRDHMRTHYDSCHCGTCESCLKKNPKFQCEICKRIFLSESKLARHSLTHSGEKPWICEICAKSFSQKSNLTVHLRSHLIRANQSNSGEKLSEENNDSLSF